MQCRRRDSLPRVTSNLSPPKIERVARAPPNGVSPTIAGAHGENIKSQAQGCHRYATPRQAAVVSCP
jgi:hypothetical protein